MSMDNVFFVAIPLTSSEFPLIADILRDDYRLSK